MFCSLLVMCLQAYLQVIYVGRKCCPPLTTSGIRLQDTLENGCSFGLASQLHISGGRWNCCFSSASYTDGVNVSHNFNAGDAASPLMHVPFRAEHTELECII